MLFPNGNDKHKQSSPSPKIREALTTIWSGAGLLQIDFICVHVCVCVRMFAWLCVHICRLYMRHTLKNKQASARAQQQDADKFKRIPTEHVYKFTQLKAVSSCMCTCVYVHTYQKRGETHIKVQIRQTTVHAKALTLPQPSSKMRAINKFTHQHYNTYNTVHILMQNRLNESASVCASKLTWRRA